MWRGRPRPRGLIEHIAVTLAPKGDSKTGVEPRSLRACFPRSVRLLRHADFERVYKLGRRHFSASMTVFYLQQPPQAGKEGNSLPRPGLRVGFTVARALGGAVQRNRMKRRLREAVRLCRPAAVTGVDVVINPKKSLLTTEFTSVVNEVSRAFAIIEQKIAESAATKQNSGSRKPEA